MGQHAAVAPFGVAGDASTKRAIGSAVTGAYSSCRSRDRGIRKGSSFQFQVGAGKGGNGASFRFPLAPAQGSYRNGHRPFSLGGGNGSKCPYTVIGSS